MGKTVEEIGMLSIEACAPNLIDEAATRITNRLAPDFGLTADGMADVHGICQEEIAAAIREDRAEPVSEAEVEAACDAYDAAEENSASHYTAISAALLAARKARTE